MKEQKIRLGITLPCETAARLEEISKLNGGLSRSQAIIMLINSYYLSEKEKFNFNADQKKMA